MRKIDLAIVILSMFLMSSAEAYIGPGAGAGTIAVVLGILASIVMAFFAILWYPFKRLLRSRKKDQQKETQERPESPDSTKEDA